ncbi:CCR4-NOT transcription complex subunit 9-like [Drosophila tropicalis]|uniref:CCR4-NOT transcription complex subunit 9-like n=1 Tax=Drosophila tropicalis TaxID=46794 RepID=UPI0035ABBD78
MSGSLTWNDSNRLCWAISLIQSIGGHPETQIPFLSSGIISFLLPILDVKVETEPVTHVKLAVLGVIGGLVKTPSKEVISFLLESANILSIIADYLSLGSKLTQLITAYILSRILEHEITLEHLHKNRKASFKLVNAMYKVVDQLSSDPEADSRILDNIVTCYKRLTQDEFAKFMLQNGLTPEQLRKDIVESEEPTTIGDH